MKVEVRESLTQFFKEVEELRAEVSVICDELEGVSDVIAQFIDDGEECDRDDMSDIFSEFDYIRSKLSDCLAASDEMADGFAMLIDEDAE